MKIDYGKIIEKAEIRRNTLEELTSKLEYAAAMEKKLFEVRDWLNDLRELFHDLDAEGRLLLPTTIQTAMQRLPQTHNNLENALNSKINSPNALTYGVSWLVEEGDE